MCLASLADTFNLRLKNLLGMVHSKPSCSKTHGHRAQTLGCQGGRGRRGIDREFGVGRGKLLHAGWTDNKVLLYSTGK